MSKYKKIALLFPGQGAQYIGMGADFVENFSAARLTFEEADEILKRKLSSLILKGTEADLTLTRNSQTGIYVASMAMFRVVKELFSIQPYVCAGLSLGEYSALTASEKSSFIQTLPLIQTRANAMDEACEKTAGGMAAIIGLNGDIVENIVKDLHLPHDLWVANFNCPGQVVISGTLKGLEAGAAAVKAAGAKKVVMLQVQGAFHSGLMQHAKVKLEKPISELQLSQGSSKLVMNVVGDFVEEEQGIRKNLIEQVTHSVRWEQGVKAMDREDVDLFIEFGPGQSLSAMNKRIGVKAPTISVDTVKDLDKLSEVLRSST